jgi:hypothetical protein
LASLYLNALVGIVQTFQKAPSLAAIAPTPNRLPFQITQLVALALFVMLTSSTLSGVMSNSLAEYG